LKIETDNLIAAHHASANMAAADLDHGEWSEARPVYLTRYWSGMEAPPSRQAEARAIWTDAALSVRFVCRQDEPLVASERPQLERKTLGLWDRDVCEIFVASDAGNPQRYLEFEAAPTAEWLDLAIEHREGERETDCDFSSGMTVAARIDAKLIKIALRIPWAAFGHAPQAGERWRVNLFRCIGTGPSRGYLAWQPTRTPQPNFHVPAVFGWMEFK
jgi:alpha-galactosidase